MREHRPASVDITHITLSVLFIALFIASTFWVLSPFLMSILWATIVSVATWPFLMRLEAFLGQTALQWFVAKAGSIGMMLLQVVLTAIIAAILFANGEIVREGILTFARRLAGQQGYDVAVLAARAIRGVVLGVVVTALLQAAIGGAGLFITGVPAAALLTAVMLFLCLAQLGPLLVLVPAVAWLYWSGKSGWGTTLLLVALVAGTIDGFVRPFLIRRGADLPLLLIFAGVIGGLIAFGIIGLFIGPVVLAITWTLLKAWVSDRALPQGAATETVVKSSL